MSEKRDAVIELLRMEDSAYFGLGDARLSELQTQVGNLSRRPRGEPPALVEPFLALGGPEAVDIDDRAVIPVLLGSVSSGMRAWQVNPKANRYIFVRQVATGELHYGLPLTDMRRGAPTLASGQGESPSEDDAMSTRSGVERVDLRKKIPQELPPGVISVTAIEQNISSNTITMRLDGQAPAAVASGVATPTAGITVRMSADLELETSIQMPDSATRGEAAVLSAEMQVSKAAGVAQVAGEDETAYWSTNVVLLALDERPKIISATVPVRRVVTDDERQRFNASFDFDLGPSLASLATGNYTVYLDTGNGFKGPFSFELNE